MELKQVLLKKKLIIALAGFFAVGTIGTVIYAVNNYYGNLTNPANKSIDANGKDTSTELANAGGVDVEVKSQIDFDKKTSSQTVKVSTHGTNESSTAPAPPPVNLPPINGAVPAGGLMNQPPTTNTQQQPPEEKKSKMLVVANDSATSNDAATNAITGTNTSIGTGVVDTQMQKQKSPYTLFAGSFIPITMQTGLNSEVKGQIVAVVNRDVYDSTTGKYLLIPQGTKAIGTYDNNVAYGMNRLVAGWNRLIYPNGTSILLHGQPGTDLEGFSGYSGTVDNHYMQIYGSSFLMGAIMSANAAAQGNQGELTQPTTTQTMSQMVGGQMAQTGLQVVQKGLNIPPTIIIRAGYNAYIAPTADLVLKPYIRSNQS